MFARAGGILAPAIIAESAQRAPGSPQHVRGIAMQTAHLLAKIAGALALVSLAACGGNGSVGDGGAASSGPAPAPRRPVPRSPPALAPGRAQSLTGSGPPTETVVDMRARAAALVSRADSFVVSTVFGNASNPNFPTFRLRPSCSGAECVWTVPGTQISWTIDVRDLESSVGESREILGKAGVTMAEFTGSDNRVDVRTYGSWLNHASFSVTTQAIETTDRTRFFSPVRRRRRRPRRERAGASRRPPPTRGPSTPLAGSAPGFAATWRGLMVGTPRAGGARDNLLQGDAALTYTADGAGGAIDAAFTNIRDLNGGVPHSTPTVRFDGVPVAADGVFEAGFIGNRIQGGFYGPGQVEAAGIFEQADIVGAFGARRVASGAPESRRRRVTPKICASRPVAMAAMAPPCPHKAR